MPVQTSDIYFDSFEIIASESPIETKEQADAAKIYYKATLNKDTVNKTHTVDLSDFENKVCYIYIRHKAEKTGYALMISHVEDRITIVELFKFNNRAGKEACLILFP